MAQQHVLIAGGGPVVFVTALEAEPAIVTSPRAMVCHWSVLEHLEGLGILEDAMRKGFTKQDYCHIVFRTGERIYWTLAPLADETRHPYNLHLGQNDLAEIARQRLANYPEAQVRFGTRIDGIAQDAHGVTATVTGPGGTEALRADWLVACDGGSSTVRQKILGMNFFGVTWPERFVATNVRFDFEAAGYARANFMMDDVYGAIIAKIDDTGLWRITVMEDAALPLDGVTDRIDAV